MKKRWVSGWLLDYAIDAYIHILCKRYDHIVAFSASQVDCLLRDRDLIKKGDQKGDGLPPTAKFVLLPMNGGSQHWTLLIFDIQKNEFIYLDSLNCQFSAKLNNMKETLLEWHNIDCTTASFRQEVCPHQGDSISCGIFVCHNAELCAKELPFQTECDKDQVRVKVFEELMAEEGNLR